MELKVRLFLDGKQVEPENLTICSPSIDRIVNDIVSTCNPVQATGNRSRQESA